MTTHELLGKECMSFTELHGKHGEVSELIKFHALWRDFENILILQDKARKFLTDPLTPEWVEEYLEVIFKYKNVVCLPDEYELHWWDNQCILSRAGQSMIIKHPSHLFESLPPEIKLNYKNVEI